MTDRRAELLDAIAQASITIQRSVAELEQLAETKRVCCSAWVDLAGGQRAHCSLASDHEGMHSSALTRWNDPPAEQRYCGMVANATGVEVKCDRRAGHDGPHQRGEMSWPNLAQLEDERPHSRACGIHAHPHGPLCSGDCPTCSGMNLGPTHRR